MAGKFRGEVFKGLVGGKMCFFFDPEDGDTLSSSYVDILVHSIMLNAKGRDVEYVYPEMPIKELMANGLQVLARHQLTAEEKSAIFEEDELAEKYLPIGDIEGFRTAKRSHSCPRMVF